MTDTISSATDDAGNTTIITRTVIIQDTTEQVLSILSLHEYHGSSGLRDRVYGIHDRRARYTDYSTIIVFKIVFIGR